MNITAESLHRETVQYLKRHEEKVTKRRQAIAALERGIRKFRALERSTILRRREGVWFSTTQGDATRGRGDLRVQVRGIDVGGLTWKEQERQFKFSPEKGAYKKGGESWSWSKSPSDAAKINAYLETFRARNVDEREIQWQLAEALRKDSVLKSLAPVTVGPYPLEVGVSVTATGNEAGKTGTIDLLGRQARGRAGGRLIVFEVKKRGKRPANRAKIEATLNQALRYATALDYEANYGSEEDRKTYRSAFGLKPSAVGPIEVGVVIVMHDDGKTFQETADKVLTQYFAETSPSPFKRIGMLLYQLGAEGKARWDWLPQWSLRSPTLS